ncbi:hypothetical protein RND71_034223 [Anisodus tanguticus]|uniref:Uncharacterized protein n=1 Tax=Anisodus tanguticus TaxID=243964 RepID=A0AAE1RAW2_9SOLA|nr:hypothetical protein RND71_034223 [Anisodus tanguticus]
MVGREGMLGSGLACNGGRVIFGTTEVNVGKDGNGGNVAAAGNRLRAAWLVVMLDKDNAMTNKRIKQLLGAAIEVVQTPSKSKASVSNTKKWRKVVHVASSSKPKNVDAHASGSEPKDDAAEEPSKPVSGEITARNTTTNPNSNTNIVRKRTATPAPKPTVAAAQENNDDDFDDFSSTPTLMAKDTRQKWSYCFRISTAKETDVGLNKGNSSGDTLRASIEEIQEGGELLGELIELEDVGGHQHGHVPTKESILATEQVDVNQQDHNFGSQIKFETFQNTSLDSDIPSHEGTYMPVDEKSVSTPSNVGLSSIVVGAVMVSDEVEQFDDLQTS